MPKPNVEFIKLQGKSRYSRLIHPDEMSNAWQITLYPTPESLEIIRSLQAEGIKNKMRKDDDGYHMRFSRPTSKKYRDKSGLERTFGLEPPEVVIRDETDPLGYKPFRDFIGDGSDVTLKLEVYGHRTPSGGTAKAARLLGVMVDTLVPYTSQEVMSEQQQKAVAGLPDVPPHRPSW